jgi:Sec-independent protein secretion pathway component TatC
MINQKLNFLINYIELKYRLIYFFVTFSITFIIFFEYRIEFFFFIAESFLILQDRFIYIGLLDPLFIYFKLAFIGSIIWVLPLQFYLFGFFFFRSLYNFYTYYFFILFLSVYNLGLYFYYFFFKFFFVFILKFLLTFQRVSNNITLFPLQLEATITQYYVFFFNLLYIYILLICIPVIFLFVNIFGLIKDDFFSQFLFKKLLYLFVLFIFLVIAPPDFFFQILLFPFILIFLEIQFYLVNIFFFFYWSYKNNFS